MDAIVPVLKEFGPMGVAVVLMGAGLVYLTRWLREDRKSTDTANGEMRKEFLTALKDQRTETASTLREVTSEFKDALKDHGDRIDHLSGRVDMLDGHVRGMR